MWSSFDRWVINSNLRIEGLRGFGGVDEVFCGRGREGEQIGGNGRSTTARKFTSGGILPTRGRIPPFLVVLVLAVASLGLVGLQILKERRTASANISEKEFELHNLRVDLKEQVKSSEQRVKELDSAQAKLLDLEHASQKAQDSLQAKDSELQNVRAQYDEAVENFKQLKKTLKLKDEEIVRIRGELQLYSFEKAKESADQINNKSNHDKVMESTLENIQAEEHKPADEAGLGDRKGLQEIEEATKDADVSALEKEMDERSKPKPDVLNEGEIKEAKIAADDKIEDSIDKGDLQDENSDEEDSVDPRDLDEKEIEASQEEDQHEESNSESHNAAGDHAQDMVSQGAETDE